ncbi:NAC domain-containing protein 78 [Apostasia shenzhenica]|uniref:NAC domain-containing protein 78 n=1 Tax=Apostasia shenzhenica TaxID=1088818 RepID=A0A2H9ZTF8_9ASPA|nr:NAC domain-containing protein 78 [Apostasia shenzhenica]
MAGLEVLLLQSLPLGFRFRPTDQELVNHYLKRKINGRIKSDVSVIPEIDVCKWEPWDLPDKSLIRSEDPEWFFFAPRDRKYQNGRRSNRATEAGYWKATGKDRTIKSRPPSPAIIGMKKTLVFYRGRAPKGERTNWIMHEYRTTEPEFESSDQGGYVLCRLFKKPEEKTLNSNAEEAEAMESSGFSPSKSSLDDSVHGEEALPGKAYKTIAKLDSPSNSNITSDIGFQKADSKFDNSHTLMDSHMPCPSFDDSSVGVISKDEDADRDSISDFLDAILSNPEDETIPETSQALARPAEVLPKVRSIRREHPLDTFSAIDREDQNLESGDYLDNLLSNFSYSDDFGAQEFLPMDFCHDNDNCESIQELMSQLGASSGLDVSQDTCETILDPAREEDNGGIGIKIRDRRLQDFYVGQQGITDQGHAYRRMRLQKSLHTVSLASGHNESAKISSKRDSNADIPEVGCSFHSSQELLRIFISECHGCLNSIFRLEKTPSLSPTQRLETANSQLHC